MGKMGDIFLSIQELERSGVDLHDYDLVVNRLEDVEAKEYVKRLGKEKWLDFVTTLNGE